MNKKFRVHWYNQYETVLIEPEYIIANNKEEAENKARELYYGKKEPAPLLWIEEVI